MVLHAGIVVEQIAGSVNVRRVRISDRLGRVLCLKVSPNRLIRGARHEAETDLCQRRLRNAIDYLVGKDFFVTKNPTHRAELSPANTEDDRGVVGIGRVFLRCATAALATGFGRGGFGNRFEIGVIDQVGTDSVTTGNPGDGFAAGTALDLQRVNTSRAVGN